MSINIDKAQHHKETRLEELRSAHRDLDDTITVLARKPHIDQLRIHELKKQKLQLKDRIVRIESEMPHKLHS